MRILTLVYILKQEDVQNKHALKIQGNFEKQLL